jgi:hypothetical protein
MPNVNGHKMVYKELIRKGTLYCWRLGALEVFRNIAREHWQTVELEEFAEPREVPGLFTPPIACRKISCADPAE